MSGTDIDVPGVLQLDETDVKNESYICFRRREIKAIRKTRAQHVTYSDRMTRLQSELTTAFDLANSVLRREVLKRDAVAHGSAVWDKRCNFVDLKRRFPGLGTKEDEELFHDKERVVKKPKTEIAYVQSQNAWLLPLTHVIGVSPSKYERETTSSPRPRPVQRRRSGRRSDSQRSSYKSSKTWPSGRRRTRNGKTMSTYVLGLFAMIPSTDIKSVDPIPTVSSTVCVQVVQVSEATASSVDIVDIFRRALPFLSCNAAGTRRRSPPTCRTRWTSPLRSPLCIDAVDGLLIRR